jgi:hypothetical protein
VPFQPVLSALLDRAEGARGAVLCDYEGEFVELVVRDPDVSEYEMKVFGAQMAAAWSSLQESATEHGAGGIVEMRITCAGGTLLCRALRDGYYVVLLLRSGVPQSTAAFLLRNTASALSAEL